jgi:type IV pilus assembly protein PilP
MRPRRVITALIFSAAALAGCGGAPDTSDLRQFVADVKARPKQPLPKLPTFERQQPPPYQSADRRAPFTPEIPERTKRRDPGNGVRPDRDRPREVLEEYRLEELAMVGTLNRGGTTLALIRTPDGVIHKVRQGHHMGRNYGKIVHITPSHIELSEIVPGRYGGWTRRTTTVPLLTE